MRGKEADETGKEHQVDGGEQRGIERGVGRAGGEGARDDPEIEREEKEVGEHQPGGDAHGKFGRAAAPDADCFVGERDYGNDGGENVELAGADDGENAGRDEEEERNLEITLHRRKGRRADPHCGGHGLL